VLKRFWSSKSPWCWWSCVVSIRSLFPLIDKLFWCLQSNYGHLSGFLSLSLIKNQSMEIVCSSLTGIWDRWKDNYALMIWNRNCDNESKMKIVRWNNRFVNRWSQMSDNKTQKDACFQHLIIMQAKHNFTANVTFALSFASPSCKSTHQRLLILVALTEP
jgi:hypothetical protein